MMTPKGIVGFSLLGIVKNEEPWRMANEVGMKELSERSGMEEFDGEGNYFEYVKEALDKIDEYKDLSLMEAVSRRRSQFFDRVLNLIKEGDYINKEFVDVLKESVKDDFEIALITTNTREFVDSVLKLADAEGVFDYIVCLDSSDEDNKRMVFDKAIKEGIDVDVFMGSEKSGKICKDLGIKFIEYDPKYVPALHDIFYTELNWEEGMLLCPKCNSREVFRSMNGCVAGEYLCKECSHCGDKFILVNKDGSFKDE